MDDLENNRAPLLSNFKLCALFHRHVWIQAGVTVRKLVNGIMTSVTLTFNHWPWPFVWTSRLSMVITRENVRMMLWQEYCQKGVTDRRTNGRTDGRTDGKKCSKGCLVPAKKHKKTGILVHYITSEMMNAAAPYCHPVNMQLLDEIPHSIRVIIVFFGYTVA